MKKLLAWLLCAAMLTAMGTTVAAAQTNDGSAGTGITINGEYVAAAAAATKISVDVVWEELSFTYQDGDKTWDPTKHQDVVAEGAWEDTKKTITVTNHSNASVKAMLSFATDVAELVGTFDKTELLLSTAENTARDAAPSDSAAFGISGGRIAADQKIGTITVTIAKYEEDGI